MEVNSNPLWAFEDLSAGSDSGWTIRIQELDLFTIQPISASLVGATGELPGQVVGNIINQCGLISSYISVSTIFLMYENGPTGHSTGDNTNV